MNRQIVFLLSVLLVTLSVGHSRGQSIPQDVRQALQNYVNSVAKGQFEWRQTIKFHAPIQELKPAFGDEPFCQYAGRVRFNWQEGKLFARTEEFECDFKSTPEQLSCNEFAFDGSDFFIGAGIGSLETFKPSMLIIDSLKTMRQKEPQVFFGGEYFQAIGIVFPEYCSDYPGKPQLELLRLIGNDSSSVSVASPDVTFVVKTDKRSYRFSFDPSQEYCPTLREEFDSDGAILSRTTVKSFTLHPGSGLTIAKQIEVEEFAGGSSAILVYEICLTDVMCEEVEDSIFSLNYSTGGTVISDSRPEISKSLKKGRVIYAIPANEHDLDEAIEIAKMQNQFQPRSNVLFWASVCVLGCLFLYGYTKGWINAN